MSKSSNRLLFKEIRSHLRERDTSVGEVTIIINQTEKGRIYHEIVTGLCESDTVLSYCDTTGILLTVFIGQDAPSAALLSEVDNTIHQLMNSHLIKLFHINRILLSYQADIGEFLFRRMLDLTEESSDDVADSSGRAGLHREDFIGTETAKVSGGQQLSGWK